MSKKALILPVALVLLALLSACSSANTPAGAATRSATPTGPDADGDGIPDRAEVLLGTDPSSADTDGDGQNDAIDPDPTFADNPIQETSSSAGFAIDAILVENNVDANNQPTPDHLELSITNTGTGEITGFDIYYTITDLTTNQVQGFFRTLPGFTLAAGERKSLHFDNTGQPDHFSADPNSMYYTDHNQLKIEVILHAAGYTPQTASVNKDAGTEAGGD
jgi:hypothetical protein